MAIRTSKAAYLGTGDYLLEVNVRATKIDVTKPASVELVVCDGVCNSNVVDPVVTELIIERGFRTRQTFTNIPQRENKVTVQNGNPGLLSLVITVNRRKSWITHLHDDQKRAIDISSAMEEDNNTITLTGFGLLGSRATVMIHDRDSQDVSKSHVLMKDRQRLSGLNFVWGNQLKDRVSHTRKP